ncbi:MAG: Rieske 2Fe-2S domain-containing protein [Nostoc sp.]|uniref:aromatic ring-hydroxylating oxygenase subunit alpha n=1 Tax=Nostoc sp. TaxID=1180 RepID=UPI002FF23B0B
MNPLSRKLRNNYWHLLCHRQEIKDSGDFIRFDWLGEEVVVFNDNGSVIAFNNLCPHRGARIFLRDFGNQPFLCSYHGWSYKNGHLSVPQSQFSSTTDFSSVTLNLLETDWCGDFLFASISPKFSLASQLSEVTPLVEAISHSIFERYDFNRYDYDCNFTIAVENALEPLHVPFVHSSSLGLLKLEHDTDTFSGVNSACYFSIGDTRTRKHLLSLKKYFSTDFQYEGYMSVYLFPFTMLSSTFGYSYSLQSFFPAHDDKTTHFTSRLLTSNLSKLSNINIIEPLFQSTSKINRQVFDEDHLICKRVPLASWSVEPPPLVTRFEERIVHFRRSCKSELMIEG